MLELSFFFLLLKGLIILSNGHLVDCNNLTVFKNVENWDREQFPRTSV